MTQIADYVDLIAIKPEWTPIDGSVTIFSPSSARKQQFLSDDEEVRVQLADSGAAAAPRRCHLRQVDGGERQHGARARLHVQSGRVWIFHLLEERGKGEVDLKTRGI